MKPGRELDMLVAEKILGLKAKKVKGFADLPRYIIEDENNDWEVGLIKDNLPHYSTDISDGWKVVDRFNEMGGAITYSSMNNGTRGHFVILSYLKSSIHSFHHYVTIEGDSPAHAICLAALKTLEE